MLCNPDSKFCYTQDPQDVCSTISPLGPLAAGQRCQRQWGAGIGLDRASEQPGSGGTQAAAELVRLRETPADQMPTPVLRLAPAALLHVPPPVTGPAVHCLCSPPFQLHGGGGANSRSSAVQQESKHRTLVMCSATGRNSRQTSKRLASTQRLLRHQGMTKVRGRFAGQGRACV